MSIEKSDICTSCGRILAGRIKGTSAFSCPACGNTLIVRCNLCREQSVPYTCKECGFTGP